VSLCPVYCDCKVCSHGVPACEDCRQCNEIFRLVDAQREHRRSVDRQRRKLKQLAVGEGGGDGKTGL
jgi:hypothetical protein